MNAELADTFEQIDALLAATLQVDDFIDLERLRVKHVDHPPFQPGEIGQPLPQPPPPIYPPAPQWHEPPQPSGLSGLVGGRRRYEDAVAVARMDYDRACLAARQEAERIHADYQSRYRAYQSAEQQRLAALAETRRRYEHECHQREADAAERNAELDTFINELAFDVESAIEEYVRIVLSNSVYPAAFPVRHEHQFNLESRELTLTVFVPPPSAVPTVREYRYVQARDEITETALPVREQKSRYASAVWQVAIRSLHEVFEADRAAKISSIALTVATTITDPATGLDKAVSFVLAAADRETFIKFDLANVVPAATLEHLGAAVSKSPFDLSPADNSRGVRTRNR